MSKPEKKSHAEKVPGFDDDDVSSLAEFLLEEIPGPGTLKRMYAYVKKRISKEYIAEIKRLRKIEESLATSLKTEAEIINTLRNYIEALEVEKARLEENIKNLKETDLTERD